MNTTTFRLAAVLLIAGSSAAASSLDTVTIDRTVRAHMDEFRACYEEALARRPGLKGKVVVRMKVERDGSVHEAGLARSTLRDEKAEACLVGVFETMQFPAFGPPCADGEDCSVSITYPLTFAPDG